MASEPVEGGLWIREGFLEEVTVSALFSAVFPAQIDQLILGFWGLYWFRHFKSHVLGDPSVLGLPGKLAILPSAPVTGPHWEGSEILDA